MIPQKFRLSSKDVRYIQKKRKMAFSRNFRIQRVPQYVNRQFSQISVYIAAKKVHKAVRRHQIKRKLITIIQSQKINLLGGKYYKLFISLNPKSNTPDLRKLDKENRDKWIDDMSNHFKRELGLLVRRVR